jgi:DnaJ-class molecular chaperone
MRSHLGQISPSQNHTKKTKRKFLLMKNRRGGYRFGCRHRHHRQRNRRRRCKQCCSDQSQANHHTLWSATTILLSVGSLSVMSNHVVACSSWEQHSSCIARVTSTMISPLDSHTSTGKYQPIATSTTSSSSPLSLVSWSSSLTLSSSINSRLRFVGSSQSMSEIMIRYACDMQRKQRQDHHRESIVPVITTIARGGYGGNEKGNENDYSPGSYEMDGKSSSSFRRRSKRPNTSKGREKGSREEESTATKSRSKSAPSSTSTTKDSSSDNKKSDSSSSRSTSSKGSTSTTGNNTNSQAGASPSSTSTAGHTGTATMEDIIAENDYYRILGTTRSEVLAQPDHKIEKFLTKLYRRRAVLSHPDKTNGDRRAFDKVAKAFEVLSDKSKRQIYDRYGAQGVDQFNTSGGQNVHPQSAEALFNMFFGGSNPFSTSSKPSSSSSEQRQRNSSVNRTVRYQIEVSLEDLYHGATRTINIPPPNDEVHTFDMFGRRTNQYPSRSDANYSPKQISIDIPPGSRAGQTIRLSGVIDFDANAVPGDAIFIVQPRQHETFIRKGHDLAITVKIPLSEALVGGVTRQIKHLNGLTITVGSARMLNVSTNNNNNQPLPIVIRDGDVHILRGRGMPTNAKKSSFGDLYIQYRVEDTSDDKYISTLTASERLELIRLLQKIEGYVVPSIDINPTYDGLEYLQKASLDEFGQINSTEDADSTSTIDEEVVVEEDNPFPSVFGTTRGRSQFFYSSSSKFGGSTFPFGNTGSPFSTDPAAEGESVQCSQM